jgi:hypothetical protein
MTRKQQPHVVVTEPDHKKGTDLATRWKREGLGSLTHGDVYRAGLKALEKRISALTRTSQKA